MNFKPKNEGKNRHVVSVLSSRLTRDLAEWQEVFWHLRAICAYVNGREAQLLLVPKTATHPFLERACELFACRSLQPDDENRALWQLTAVGVPQRDLLAANCADEIMVLYVRRGGAIYRLLLQLLELPVGSRPRVNLAMLHRTPREVRDDLLARGAIAWLPGLDRTAENARSSATTQAAVANASAGIEQGSPPIPNALLHCTRAQYGPWPGETSNRHLDDLLLGLRRAHHNALASLIRIVASRRLIASNRGIRGGYAVVSFAQVELAKLPGLRTYRPHRGRWDFEPFGIGIRQEWLKARGASPVIYGSEEDWERLDPIRRPYFQKAESGSGDRSIDWTTEREWRHLGDIDLVGLPTEAAYVFVARRADAEHLCRICEWPVFWLETDASD